MAPILSIEEAKSFLKSKEYLLSTPNVVSLGFINEKVNGKKTGGKIFRVGVIEIKSKDNIKDPDIFVPKFLKHTKSNSNEMVRIPVQVVEEGELELLISSDEDENPGNNAPYKGGSRIMCPPLQGVGCLGANAQYEGSYRLFSAAHFLTKFDPRNIGNEIMVRDNDNYVEIGARVTGQAYVALYDTPDVRNPQFAQQDLAWANITEDRGSPEIEVVGTPTQIRPVRQGEGVKYYGGRSRDNGRHVKVEDVISLTKPKVLFPDGAIKYCYFEDVCRIEPENSGLTKGDSGTAIVAEDDDALLGILMSGSNCPNTNTNRSTYYFSKLALDNHLIDEFY